MHSRLYKATQQYRYMNGQLQVCVCMCVRQLDGWILCAKSRMPSDGITCASAGVLQAPQGVTICT